MEKTKNAKMKPGGSRTKGLKYQRHINKILSNWWGEKNSFVSSPGSGAWGKIVAPADMRVAGDSIVPKEFPFCIEMKKEQSFEFHLMITSPDKHSMTQYLNKLISEDCMMVNKKPMLIFSKNFWGDYVIILKKDFDMFNIMCTRFEWYVDRRVWVIMLLSDFLTHVKKEDILNIQQSCIRGE